MLELDLKMLELDHGNSMHTSTMYQLCINYAYIRSKRRRGEGGRHMSKQLRKIDIDSNWHDSHS